MTIKTLFILRRIDYLQIYINFLFINDGNEANWISINCEGVISNSAAIGAKVWIKTTVDDEDFWQMKEISAQTGYSGQNSMVMNFGLADATIIDSLFIQWPRLP